jgi:serine/threonine kinase PknH
MSDVSQGDGWWQGSDLKWYPPASLPEPEALPPDQPPQVPIQSRPSDGGFTRRSRTPMVVMAVITAVAVLALAGVLVYRFVVPAPPNPPQPVAEAALTGFWLSPNEINAALGTTGLTIDATSAGMADQSAILPDTACLPLQGAAQARVYEGSGWSVLRTQSLQEPGNKFTHHVDQAVVLFPSAQEASTFFTSTARQWSACSNRQYRVLTGVPGDLVWTAGPLSNVNHTLSAATETQPNAPVRINGHRALIVANNVAIDVLTYSRNPSDTISDSAVNIAQQIAAKVPAT